MSLHSVITADQVELFLEYFPPHDAARPIVLYTHGVGSSFYSSPLRRIAELLARSGIGGAVLNNRGHDWLTMNRRDGRWLGAACERFEDCTLDIAAGLE